MTPWTTDLLNDLEAQLRNAMLKSDVDALDRLISDDLLFTNHLGQLMSKEDDLQGHRSGFVKIETIDILESQQSWLGDTAIVSARVRIVGSFGEHHADSTLRFTRVWAYLGGEPRIMAGHSCLVA